MKLLSRCPACNGTLKIRALQCTDCGLELRSDFEFNLFDCLDAQQTQFLMCFLRCRGNLSMVQKQLELSYPMAKKQLSSLLEKLGLESAEEQEHKKGEFDLGNWNVDTKSTKASEIIKAKLKQAGGRVIIQTINGKSHDFVAERDGKSFTSKALPIVPSYTYHVFDVIVDLLLSQGGKAVKGCGRNAKLGEPNCEETTVVGAIGKNYAGKKPGDSVFDPVFFFASVLDWAGVAHNRRGYLELTEEYKMRLKNANERNSSYD